MDEAKLALEVTKGIKGLFQDLIAPDVKAIIAVLNSHTELLREHSQKLAKLTVSVSELRAISSSHTELLKEHGQILREHSQKLDKLSVSASEMKYVPKLLDEHTQKLDKLAEGMHQLNLKQGEILARLDLEKRVSALEKAVAGIKG